MKKSGAKEIADLKIKLQEAMNEDFGTSAVLGTAAFGTALFGAYVSFHQDRIAKNKQTFKPGNWYIRAKDKRPVKVLYHKYDPRKRRIQPVNTYTFIEDPYRQDNGEVWTSVLHKYLTTEEAEEPVFDYLDPDAPKRDSWTDKDGVPEYPHEEQYGS